MIYIFFYLLIYLFLIDNNNNKFFFVKNILIFRFSIYVLSFLKTHLLKLIFYNLSFFFIEIL